MKKIVPIITISLLLLISCLKKPANGYVIIGDVKNIPSSRVYLRVMKLDSAGQPKWPVIDSANCKDGKFIFRSDTVLKESSWGAMIFYKDAEGKNKSLSFYNKFNTTSRYGGFVLESAKTVIKGDIKDKKGLIISGSPETEFSFKYGLMQPPLTKLIRLNSLEEKIDSLQKAGDTALGAIILQYKMKRDSAIIPYENRFKKVIQQHPDRFCALFNIYNNRSTFSLDELQELASIMNKNIMESPTGKKLAGYIKRGNTLLPGKHFPDFSYNDTTGRPFNLKAIKGEKATLVVFWASWCVPCRQEIPALKDLYQQYRQKGLSLVSISIDDNINLWKKGVRDEKMPWINLSNLPGDYQQIMANYDLSFVSAMYLLDQYGNIVVDGTPRFFLIKEKIKELLGN